MENNASWLFWTILGGFVAIWGGWSIVHYWPRLRPAIKPLGAVEAQAAISRKAREDKARFERLMLDVNLSQQSRADSELLTGLE